MMAKDDVASKLQQREERRRSSVVASMVNAPVMQPVNAGEKADLILQPMPVVAPGNREVRSRRKQILLQPTIHDLAEAKCRKLNISMNEVINQLLGGWVDE